MSVCATDTVCLCATDTVSLCAADTVACAGRAGPGRGFAESLGLLVPPSTLNYSHTQDCFPAAAGDFLVMQDAELGGGN